MKKYEFYIIIIWLLFRAVFHSIDFTGSMTDLENECQLIIEQSIGERIMAYLYYAGSNSDMLGFFIILRNLWIRGSLRISFLTKSQGNRFTKFLIIFSTWCLIIDHLLLFGLGAHDSIFYTISCIGGITIGALWVKFA